MMHDDDVSIELDGHEEPGMSEAELEAQESKADGKFATLKSELARCRAERQEYLDGWQRAKADYVNAQKRAAEERMHAGQAATRATLEAFLPALDSLARAEVSGTIPAGFEGIAKLMRRSAETLGVTPFGAVGDRFDPARHEALGEDPAADDAQDHTVSAVLETGWLHGQAVLRPARVRVFVRHDATA